MTSYFRNTQKRAIYENALPSHLENDIAVPFRSPAFVKKQNNKKTGVQPQIWGRIGFKIHSNLQMTAICNSTECKE